MVALTFVFVYIYLIYIRVILIRGDLCEPNPCGANAKCTPGHDRTGAERPVCTCPTGYRGNALVSCEKVFVTLQYNR